MDDEEIEEAVDQLAQDVRFRSVPSKSQLSAINRLLFSEDPEEIRDAIALIKEAYGIGFKEDVVVYDPNLKEDIEGKVEASTDPGKAPVLGYYAINDAKKLGEDYAHIRLALTVAHEGLHQQQFRRLGDFDRRKVPLTEEWEISAFVSENERVFHEVQAYTSETLNLTEYTRLKYGSVGNMPEDEKEQLIGFKKDAQKKRHSQYLKPGAWKSEELQERQKEVNSLLQRFRFAEALILIRTDDNGYFDTKYGEQLEGKTHY